MENWQPNLAHKRKKLLNETDLKETKQETSAVM